MGGKAIWLDPSLKVEGKVFGNLINDETALCKGLVHHPRSIPMQVQVHLLGQALSVTALPYSVSISSIEIAKANACT
jgi:hypothetical protein